MTSSASPAGMSDRTCCTVRPMADTTGSRRSGDELAGHLLQPRRPARGVEADRLRPAVLTAGEAELRP